MTTFGTRLREARQAKGLTQEQVAQAFGLSRGAVARWESDDNKPEADKLPRLAQMVGKSVDYLLRGRDAPAPPVSVSQPINVDLLANVIAGTDAALREHGIALDNARRASLYALVYEHYEHRGGVEEVGALNKFLRLIQR